MNAANESWAEIEEAADLVKYAIKAYLEAQYDYQWRVRGDNGLGIPKERALREAKEITETLVNGAVQSSYHKRSHTI